MFHFWRRRQQPVKPHPPALPTAQASRPRARAEGAAGPALAGPAEPEAPARGRRRAGRTTREERREVLAELERSEASLDAFAEAHGLPHRTPDRC